MNGKYKFNKEWLDLLLEHKNNANITFNLSNNDTRILLTYIEKLQQENTRLKDKIGKAVEYINDLSLDFYDYECEKLIVSKYMINELLNLLKEDNKEEN